jgi:hypothetical protein
MMKIGTVIVLFLACSTLGAQELTVTTGMDLNYAMGLYLDFSTDNTFTSIVHYGGFGAFIDTTYFRLTVDYSFFFAGTSIDDSGSHEMKDTSIDFLNFYLLGKYPFSVGDIAIWPSLGIGFTYCINFHIPPGGSEDIDETSFDDLHLLAGLGMDFKVNTLYISPYFTFSFNLMPQMQHNPPPGLHSYNLGFLLGVSIGYALK